MSLDIARREECQNTKWEKNVESMKKAEIFHVRTKLSRKYSLNFARQDHYTICAINKKLIHIFSNHTQLNHVVAYPLPFDPIVEGTHWIRWFPVGHSPQR